MKAITLGCDPELAVRDRNSGVFISAIGKVPGDKHAPFKVEGSAVGLTIHPDNVSLEFNIDPTTPKQFSKNMLAAMREVDG